MPSKRYLFFIPFLRTKSQMGQTTNLSSEKSHKKDKTNIIATNFVWEQLNVVSKNLIAESLRTLVSIRQASIKLSIKFQSKLVKNGIFKPIKYFNEFELNWTEITKKNNSYLASVVANWECIVGELFHRHSSFVSAVVVHTHCFPWRNFVVRAKCFIHGLEKEGVVPTSKTTLLLEQGQDVEPLLKSNNLHAQSNHFQSILEALSSGQRNVLALQHLISNSDAKTINAQCFSVALVVSSEQQTQIANCHKTAAFDVPDAHQDWNRKGNTAD